ncbi:MAG: hypothetical protein DHS20C16_22680 [Phycisphaerae bacterium]|nr:MAG: hypothetical protein DHS20C16_22680 [Phycisphaerae bacterium]
MNCNEIETMLADYLGNELSDRDHKIVDDHLQGCEACAHEVMAFQQTVSTLGQLDTVSHADALRRTSRFQVSRRTPALQRIVFASLKIAAVLAIGFVLGRLSFGETAKSQPDVAKDSGTGQQMVAHANSGTIHPEWLEFAEKLNRNSSGLAGQLRHLAKGYGR